MASALSPPGHVNGRLIDLAAIPYTERRLLRVFECEYIDRTVTWIKGEGDPPGSWMCPACGGRDFDLVHPDYPPSGFGGSGFELVD